MPSCFCRLCDVIEEYDVFLPVGSIDQMFLHNDVGSIVIYRDIEAVDIQIHVEASANTLENLAKITLFNSTSDRIFTERIIDVVEVSADALPRRSPSAALATIVSLAFSGLFLGLTPLACRARPLAFLLFLFVFGATLIFAVPPTSPSLIQKARSSRQIFPPPLPRDDIFTDVGRPSVLCHTTDLTIVLPNNPAAMNLAFTLNVGDGSVTLSNFGASFVNATCMRGSIITTALSLAPRPPDPCKGWFFTAQGSVQLANSEFTTGPNLEVCETEAFTSSGQISASFLKRADGLYPFSGEFDLMTKNPGWTETTCPVRWAINSRRHKKGYIQDELSGFHKILLNSESGLITLGCSEY